MSSLRYGMVTLALIAPCLATAQRRPPEAPAQTARQVSGIFRGGTDALPRRLTLCSESCRVENGSAILTETCRPYVDRTQVDTTQPTVTETVLSRPPAAPQCSVSSPMMMIADTSPNCWVSNTRYCRYRPAGRMGFSCSCGSRSGYFG